nr:helix-turn-helix domain-containing protein [Nocardiopsis mwathae]
MRRLRKHAGLTQEQLAERAGVGVRTIRRLETGKSADHRLATVNLLADALNASPEDRQKLTGPLVPAPREPGTPQSAPDAQPSQLSPPFRGSARGMVPSSNALVGAADALAREVGRRWQREEDQRRVPDPFPLPVRWQQAPADLTDHAENIQRLPPGAPPQDVDLSGDVGSVAETYRRISSGRLVILGRAGSGKSILAIRFVLDLLSAPDSPGRVPVIFGLGSWDPTTTALRDLLVDGLLRDHPHLAERAPGGGTLAAALVDAGLILPVLDGFDEIADGLRGEALHTLNTTPSMPLVLTSRRDEYARAVRTAHSPLVWAAGIELSDLTLDDLAGYLPRTARPVAHGDASGGDAGLWDAVMTELRSGLTQGSVNLAGVLRTPLMVGLARTMYSETPGSDPEELLDTTRFPTEDHLEEHLLAGFIPAVYRRRAPERSDDGQPRRHRDAHRAQHWLGYLARQNRGRQDLGWWRIAGSLGLPTRVLNVVLVATLCVAVSIWIVGAFLSPWVVDEPWNLGMILLQGALFGPCAGVAFGAAYCALPSFRRGAVEPSHVRLRLPVTSRGVRPRPVRAFTARFTIVMLGGVVVGSGLAWADVLLGVVRKGNAFTDPGVLQSAVTNMLVFGLIFGTAAGLVFGLLAVLEAPMDITAAATPVRLLSSNRTTAARQFLVLVPTLSFGIALSGHVVVALFQQTIGPLAWGLPSALLFGAAGGLGGASSYVLAFTAWGQWLTLSRIWLPLTGRLPWDLVAFLDDAYRRGVLRQTGAVHQFRHIRLQHHLDRTFCDQQADPRPARAAASP